MTTNIKQRGYKSYGELTLNEVLEIANRVLGEWNGDEPGEGEKRTDLAVELAQSLNKVIDIVIELEEM